MADRISIEAQRIYNQTRHNPRYVEIIGEQNLSPVERATLPQIEAHLRLVDAVAREFGFPLDASKIEFGASREAIVAIAEGKARQYRRRAGVRALEKKYGHEAAARIVKRHSGRTIRG